VFGPPSPSDWSNNALSLNSPKAKPSGYLLSHFDSSVSFSRVTSPRRVSRPSVDPQTAPVAANASAAHPRGFGTDGCRALCARMVHVMAVARIKRENNGSPFRQPPPATSRLSGFQKAAKASRRRLDFLQQRKPWGSRERAKRTSGAAQESLRARCGALTDSTGKANWNSAPFLPSDNALR